MNSKELFTAPQVAKICSTDLKTIHNWVNRGEITSFRTPGRHLRFRREDVLEFLNRFGYPIPTDLVTMDRKRLVVVDGDNQHLGTIKQTLADDFDVEIFNNHMDALLSIGNQRPHLVLVNGEMGDDVMSMVERLSYNDNGAPVAVYGTDTAVEQTARGAGAQGFIPTSHLHDLRKWVDEMV